MKGNFYKALLLSIFAGSVIQAAGEESEQSRYDFPIITSKEMVAYFADKTKVRVEVSVEDATGRGDRALDFFMVEPNGDVQNIPITLAAILPKSDFLKLAINMLFKSGAEVLKISEALSDPSGRETINGFIGITQNDFPSGG